MAEFIISSYFQDASGPVTGLSPTIRIWEVSSAGDILVIGTPCGTDSAVDGTMLEVSDCGSPETEQDGFYRYTFTTYDPTKAYLARVDGGVTLSAVFRYQAIDISCADSAEGIADAVWNAEAGDYPFGSPITMGGIQNNIEVIRLTDIPAIFMLLDLVRKYNTNRTKIDATANTLTVYDDDCTTVLRTFRLLDSSATPSVEEVCERLPIGGSGSPPIGPDGLQTCE